MVVLPYVKGLSERVVRILKQRRVSSAMRSHTTLRRMLVNPKHTVELQEEVYTTDCETCEKQYIGEMKRLNTTVKEHREELEKIMAGRTFTMGTWKQFEMERWKLTIMDHTCQTNHTITWDRARIVTKEVMVIRKHCHKIIRDERRYMLSHLYENEQICH